MIYRLVFFLGFALPLLAEASISVVDYQGTEIRLDRPAKRIVSLAPHITENLYSAGAGDKVVGVVSYSDFPEDALKKPIVGDYSTTNYEKITALQPDLIVAWNSGGSQDVVEKLRALGFEVYVDEPHKLNDVARSIRDFGALAGTQAYAKKSAASFLSKLNSLREIYRDKQAVSVFYQVWMEPLQTLNGKHIVSDVLSLCGGKNVFSKALNIAPKVNIEAVIEHNPLAIISAGERDELIDLKRSWNKWKTISAVQKNNIFVVPSDIISRHSTRLLNGAEKVCQHLDNARISIH